MERRSRTVGQPNHRCGSRLSIPVETLDFSVFHPHSVAYLGPADKYCEPLPSRLKGHNQSVMSPSTRFSIRHPSRLA
jgi:hypothetical protein